MPNYTLHPMDCRIALSMMDDNSVDSVVTDPPYALVSIVKRFGGANAAPAKGDVYARASAGFMGKTWDTGETAFAVEFWAEVMRVLKPGGHVVAASGTRTYHRLAVAVEDAGFEIRDMLSWLYGSGFPKSHDVSKGIDRAAGAERERIPARGGLHKNANLNDDNWKNIGDDGATMASDQPATPEAAAWQGWGTALKPACEPWVLARKPLIGTVAANVLAHGTGALNIDGCRIATDDVIAPISGKATLGGTGDGWDRPWKSDPDALAARQQRANLAIEKANTLGRWPANVIHDGSDEVVGAFPDANHKTGGAARTSIGGNGAYHGGGEHVPIGFNDSGSAARFFYCAKASRKDRGPDNKHPTVKPTDLMRYFCRLVTPPGGTVFDPFAGSGSTGKAALLEGFNFIGCEMTPEYIPIAEARLAEAWLEAMSAGEKR